MPTATVTSKGQVTLPKKVREALRINPGDRIDFVLDAEGGAHLRPGRYDITGLKGILRRPGRRPVTLERMQEAIERRGERRK